MSVAGLTRWRIHLTELRQGITTNLLVHVRVRFVELILEVGFRLVVLIVELDVQVLRPVAVPARSRVTQVSSVGVDFPAPTQQDGAVV